MERVKALDQAQPHAVLATSGPDGPHTSLVSYAFTSDRQGLLFATPKKSRKFLNIQKEPRVSLLVDTRTNTPKDYLGAEALSVFGHAYPLRKSKRRDEFEKIFLKKHPRLAYFLKASSIVLVLVKVDRFSHVAQFQSVSALKVR